MPNLTSVRAKDTSAMYGNVILFNQLGIKDDSAAGDAANTGVASGENDAGTKSRHRIKAAKGQSQVAADCREGSEVLTRTGLRYSPGLRKCVR